MSARTRAWFGLPVLLGLSTLLVASFSCNPVKAKSVLPVNTASTDASSVAVPALPPATPTGPFADQMANCEQRPFTAQKVSCQFSVVSNSVRDALVSVSVSKKIRRPRLPHFFEQFFGNPRPKSKRAPKGPRGNEGSEDDDADDSQVQQGGGSGFVIDAKEGIIVTNHHVAGDADTIEITLADQSKYQAKLVGTDPYTDVAIIKIKGTVPKSLQSLRFGNSEALQQGEWVIAAGNPFGLDHSINVGVLSAKGRKDVTASPLSDSLQIDAPINPGNSGGPLLNLSGEVIGINNAIYGPGANVGIGFAIPSNLASPVIDALRKSGKIERGYMGIAMAAIPDENLRNVKRFADRGMIPKGAVLVEGVEKASPAAKAGLKPGDWIVRVDGKPIEGGEMIARAAVTRAILSRKPGDTVVIEVLREDKKSSEDSDPTVKKLSVTVTLGATPSKPKSAESPYDDEE